ncbi:unnamed protein product [Linum trigynum]|uniref:Uncharacterized protein n=1 Tax=Linum trigynum TaxID=586398 RepID=A0AAV2GBR5_9ROSI
MKGKEIAGSSACPRDPKNVAAITTPSEGSQVIENLDPRRIDFDENPGKSEITPDNVQPTLSATTISKQEEGSTAMVVDTI